jgi:hypothetical protein
MYECIKAVKFDEEVLFIEGFKYKLDSFEEGSYYMVAEDGSSVQFEDDFNEYFKL